MFRIELMGPPGSGKSEVMKNLLHYHNRQVRKSEKWIEAKHASIFQFFDNNLLLFGLKLIPERVALLARNELANRSTKFKQAGEKFMEDNRQWIERIYSSQAYNQMPESEAQLGIHRLKEIGACYELLKSKANWVFFDEGYLQKIMGFFLTIQNQDPHNMIRDDVSDYVKSAPNPLVTIRIDAHETVCLERMINRRKELPDRLRNLETGKILQFLKNSRKLFEVVTEVLRAENQNVIEIENNGDQTVRNLNLNIYQELRQYG